MRRLAIAAAAAVLAVGCGSSVTVSGTMQDDADGASVWHYRGDERAEIEADSFRLEGLRGEAIDLRFTDDDGAHARMEIREVSGGAHLRLLGVWVDDGVAYPSRVEGVDRVVVNGVRMGDPASLPGTVDERGVVMAAGRSGDAFIVRPLEGGLPDLRVVVSPATEVVSPDGEPAPARGTAVGDTVQVAGGVESGYVVATRLEVPRRAALREDGDDDEGDGDGVGTQWDDWFDVDREGGEPRGRNVKDDDRRGGPNRGRGKGRGPGG